MGNREAMVDAVLREAAGWSLSDVEWYRVNVALSDLTRAISAGDSFALAAAETSLRMAGPCRAGLGFDENGEDSGGHPAPPAIRDVINRLIHRLGYQSDRLPTVVKDDRRPGDGNAVG
jgi:hypothetical protein